MKYLYPETLQIFFISLYSEKNSPLSFFTPDECFNTIADICDKGLVDCFYFDVDKEKVDQLTKVPYITENIEYTEDTVGNLIQKAIYLKSKNSKISFENFMKPGDSFLQELILTGHFYNINFYKSYTNKLIDSLTEYIELFNKNHLSSDINFYDCKVNLKKTLNILKKYYDENGYRFNISGNEKTDFVNINFEPKLRFYEVILSLIFKGFIEIINCNLFIDDKKRFLNIEFNLKNKPKEIERIENSYISYGDLTVNKINGFACYRDNPPYHFETSSRAFKLLVELIKDPEIEKSISTLYSLITKDQEDAKVRKQRIIEYVKEIKRKLNIVGNNKTINIRIIDGSFIMLTQN